MYDIYNKMSEMTSNFNNYSDEQIEKILTNYKNKRDRENKYYHNISKNNEDYRLKNRERAKAHYDKVGKEMKRKRYEENKELIKAKSLLQYYKKKDDIKTFKEKHNDKYIMFLENTIESM